MRQSLLKMSFRLACISVFIQSAHANYTSSSSQTPPAPPSVISNSYNISPAPPSTTVINHRRHHRGTSVFSSNTPAFTTRHHAKPFWIAMHSGEPIPTNAVVGGSQYNPNAMFYICRANYRGGVHPGKFLAGNCNISWGGREIMMQNYDVLVSDKPLVWVESSQGAIPHRAVIGGRENRRNLYICQADYENGTHPGKIIGKNCNFGWGGKEVMTPYYNVLTS